MWKLQYGVSYQTLQCEVGKNFVQKLTTTLDDKKLNLEIQLRLKNVLLTSSLSNFKFYLKLRTIKTEIKFFWSFGKKNGAFMVSEVFLLSGYRVREVVTQRSVWHLQQQHVLVVYTLEKVIFLLFFFNQKFLSRFLTSVNNVLFL